MRILMTGGTGFIGSALTDAWVARGYHVLVLSRGRPRVLNPNVRIINSLDTIPDGDYFECFINLAGENLAGERWSEARKAALVESRVDTTNALFDLAARLERPPAVLLSASAVGFYGHRGNEILEESDPGRDGFSHRLCQAWEDAALRFESLGTRVCLLRLGVVLAGDGGAFRELTQTAALGIGAWPGNGRQWLSWVHREDVLEAMAFLHLNESLRGVFNLTAPDPVTYRGFYQELAQHRTLPLRFGVPGFLMRLGLGEVATELLLNGQRVMPRRLLDAGYQFHYASLAEALPAVLEQ